MSTMKALVFEGTGKRTIQERPMPKIEQATDAVVKILKTTICGTDLHILRGDVPTCSPGRILGHEAVGVIDSVGDSVKKFKRGDRVIVFPMTTCSSCGPCAKGMFAHCENGGGWQLGNRIDGVQAEYARVPFADGSLQHMISGASDEAQLIISDVLTTGYECGAIAGRVKPGDTVAIIGAGPVGLGTLLCCQLFSPSTVIVIDLDANRLETAKAMGATHTLLSDSKTVQGVLDLTDGRGADVVIEGVGIPSTFELCQEIVAIGGTIANIGVHGKPGELHLEKLWDRNITIALNLVSCSSAPTLIKLAGAGKLDTSKLVTHTFKFNEMENAYTTFTDAAQHNALKLVIDFD